MTAVVRADKLTKFCGRVRGVVDLDFEVGAGEVLGFLDPNGAGKTTTVRLLPDLVRPTRGRIEVSGADPRRDVGVRRAGYLRRVKALARHRVIALDRSNLAP